MTWGTPAVVDVTQGRKSGDDCDDRKVKVVDGEYPVRRLSQFDTLAWCHWCYSALPEVAYINEKVIGTELRMLN